MLRRGRSLFVSDHKRIVTADSQATQVFLPGRWLPENYRRINEFLDSHRPDKGRGQVAAFDFDNTLVRGDLGHRFFFEVLEKLLLNENDPGLGRVLSAGDRSDRLLNMLKEARTGRVTNLEFQSAALTLYHDLLDQGGPLLAYPWATQILSGLQESLVRKLARDLIQEQITHPFEYRPVSYGDGLETIDFWGLRLIEEMESLLREVAAVGFQVHILTGTCQLLVEEFVDLLKLPVFRVHGMQVEIDQGRLTDRLDLPVTYGEGKLELIRERIGKRPLLVAGDGPNDLAMLQYSSGLSLFFGRTDSEVGRIAAEKNWIIQPPFDGSYPKPL